MANDAFNISGKVALVTGGLGGIGQAVVRKLFFHNTSKVIIADMHPSSAPSYIQLSSTYQTALHYIQIDMSSITQTKDLISRATEEYGPIDILINCVGIATFTKLYRETESEVVDRIINVNLVAPIDVTRQFVKQAIAEDRQVFVLNMSSVSGMVPGRGFELYGSTKAGLNYFTRTNGYLRNARICSLSPNFTLTPMIEGSRIVDRSDIANMRLVLEPNEVAEAVVRLAEDMKCAGKVFVLFKGVRPVAVPVHSLSYAFVVVIYLISWFIEIVRGIIGGPRHERPHEE